MGQRQGIVRNEEDRPAFFLSLIFGPAMPITAEFTRAELEAGRKLFAGEWRFVSAAGSFDSLPRMNGIEVAFAGRSNVGKSSLINALTGRKNLARTSHTPGRTQEIVFFAGGGKLQLADMPGYGYAEAPKEKVQAWTRLIHAYLKGRANLARVYLLVDAPPRPEGRRRSGAGRARRSRRQPPNRADQGRSGRRSGARATQG